MWAMSRKVKKTDRGKAWNRKLTKTKPPHIGTRSKAKSFYIVCEGMNTEPEYFKSFPLGNAQVESFGLGQSKTKLVESVIELLTSDESLKEKEVWVVFDMDINQEQGNQQKGDYNRAVELAYKNSINVAYSNDTFELWFVLHYQYIDTPWNRGQYFKRLSELWGCNYSKDGKTKAFCERIYQILLEDEHANQEKAIYRAKKLHDEQAHLAISDKTPCTTVFQLVQELNQYL
ncbi:hypothetical protein IX84_04940 [Phaeodactylibacter xiamenensis]|uniref:Abortive phage resistance protein n=2 Tax=Phaeodactylibacter xiamenensis TaxID=1524460 RepID=A0A098SDN8_9BACT|nr:hypothetical protein IX84_04940 [Phaeodactylibacter xiamenensis]